MSDERSPQFQEGQLAYHDEGHPTSPYEPFSKANSDWQRGWLSEFNRHQDHLWGLTSGGFDPPSKYG